MPSGNLNREVLLNTIKGDAANGTMNAIPMLKKRFPELSDAQYKEIIDVIVGAMEMDEGDRVSLVATALPSFAINECDSLNDKRC